MAFLDVFEEFPAFPDLTIPLLGGIGKSAALGRRVGLDAHYTRLYACLLSLS